MKLVKTISAFVLLGIMTISCGQKKQAESTEMTDSTAVAMDTTVVVAPSTIVDVAAGNADFSTLVTAVKAAGLVETLSSEGPFTVFAPNNAAFAKLPAGTVDGLLKPESLDKLKAVLTYHVVAGRMSSADVAKAIKAGNGKAEFKTVQGGILTAMMSGKDVVLKDEKGNTSKITIMDVNQSNGVIHVIDAVALPK